MDAVQVRCEGMPARDVCPVSWWRRAGPGKRPAGPPATAAVDRQAARPNDGSAGAAADPGLEPWRDLCVDSGLRQLDLTRRMTSTLDAAMRDQADPDVLDVLYALDSLVCQSRRYAENLYVLSGRPLVDADRQVTSLADLINAARGRIGGWQRINLGPIADIAVARWASGDLIRVLTELMDNATRYSPQTAPISASGHLLNDGGVLLRVEDGGMSIPASDVVRHNRALLSSDPAATVVSGFGGSVQQGLQVVRRAAGANGVRVWLTARSPQGTTAQVLIPAALVWEIPTTEDVKPDGDSTEPRPGRRSRPPARGLPTSPVGALNGSVAARPKPNALSHLHGEGSAKPPQAGQGTPGRLPIRIPQPLRDNHPVAPIPVRRTNIEPGTGLAAAVDQLAAFDAATGGSAAPAKPEGTVS